MVGHKLDDIAARKVTWLLNNIGFAGHKNLCLICKNNLRLTGIKLSSSQDDADNCILNEGLTLYQPFNDPDERRQISFATPPRAFIYI